MDSKQVKKEKEQLLIELVSDFCHNKLNEEYKNLCVKMVEKLGRKKTVPFITGRLEIWASSIIYTIGNLNFLFDKSFEPSYIPSSAIHEYFGTSSSTVSAKSKIIRDLLKVNRFKDEFSTNLMTANNPFNRFVVLNNAIVSFDDLAEELRKMSKDIRSESDDCSSEVSE